MSPAAAVDLYRRALAGNPRNPHLWIELLYSLDAVGDSEAVLAALALHDPLPVRPPTSTLYDAYSQAERNARAGFDPNAPSRSADIVVAHLIGGARASARRGDAAAATDRLRQAWALRPGHTAVRAALEDIESGGVATVAPGPSVRHNVLDDLLRTEAPSLRTPTVEAIVRAIASPGGESAALAAALAECCAHLTDVRSALLSRAPDGLVPPPALISLHLADGDLGAALRILEAGGLGPEDRRDAVARCLAHASPTGTVDAATDGRLIDQAEAALTQWPDDLGIADWLIRRYRHRHHPRALVLHDRVTTRLQHTAPEVAFEMSGAEAGQLRGASVVRDGRRPTHLLLYWAAQLPDRHCYRQGEGCVEVVVHENVVPNGDFNWPAGRDGTVPGFTRTSFARQPPAAPGSESQHTFLDLQVGMAGTSHAAVSLDVSLTPGTYLLLGTLKAVGGAEVSLGLERHSPSARTTFDWISVTKPAETWTPVGTTVEVHDRVAGRVWIRVYNHSGRTMGGMADTVRLVRLH